MIHLSDRQALQLRRLVLITGFVTTLIVWLSLADPIFIPKMFFLTILSAWILGTSAVAVIYGRQKKLPLGLWAVIVFAVGIVVAGLLTDVRYTAFYGASQRSNGVFSYLALATLALTAMISFGSPHIGQIRTALLAVGAILTGYGLLQVTGNDPFSWVLTYGPIVGTLGNPDFMSATIGTCSIATLWFVFARKERMFQIVGVVLILLELLVVKKSGSSQGLFIITLGFSLLLITKFWQQNKKAGLLVLSVAVVGSIPVLMGLLNKGPLAERIYRASIRSRLDYWDAAISMFKARPFAGVGLDRFGENYGQYAPQVQVVQFQGTDNAHNVFLQFLATGGLLVTLPYLFLLGIIFTTAVRRIKKARGREQLDLMALFSIWVSLLLISSISIDNLGSTVWFWILGGVLYGATYVFHGEIAPKKRGKKQTGRNSKQLKANNATYVSPLVSLVLAVLVLAFMVPAWRTSAMVMDLRRENGATTKTQYIEKIKAVAEIQPKNVQTLITLTDFSLRLSEPDLALGYAKRAIEKDPKSINGTRLISLIYEKLKDYSSAIIFRTRLLRIDPWNTYSMVELVKDYVQVKDIESARAIAERISRLEPGGSNATAAAALVKG